MLIKEEFTRTRMPNRDASRIPWTPVEKAYSSKGQALGLSISSGLAPVDLYRAFDLAFAVGPSTAVSAAR
jgi:hypothetical protein